jgi:hypothetical protein
MSFVGSTFFASFNAAASMKSRPVSAAQLRGPVDDLAATYAAYRRSLADGRVSRRECAVLFNCATGFKYPLPPVHRTLDINKEIDFAKL